MFVLGPAHIYMENCAYVGGFDFRCAQIAKLPKYARFPFLPKSNVHPPSFCEKFRVVVLKKHLADDAKDEAVAHTRPGPVLRHAVPVVLVGLCGKE